MSLLESYRMIDILNGFFGYVGAVLSEKGKNIDYIKFSELQSLCTEFTEELYLAVEERLPLDSEQLYGPGFYVEFEEVASYKEAEKRTSKYLLPLAVMICDLPPDAPVRPNEAIPDSSLCNPFYIVIKTARNKDGNEEWNWVDATLILREKFFDRISDRNIWHYFAQVPIKEGTSPPSYKHKMIFYTLT